MGASAGVCCGGSPLLTLQNRKEIIAILQIKVSMMANLLVRGVDEKVVRALKERAGANG